MSSSCSDGGISDEVLLIDMNVFDLWRVIAMLFIVDPYLAQVISKMAVTETLPTNDRQCHFFLSPPRKLARL